MKALHILNGDATLHKFIGDNRPEGDVLVWREVLSEGPIAVDIPYEDFFSMRAAWIAEAFNSSATDYKQKVTDEFLRLNKASRYSEITLWFEFDLHCQVNLLFLLDYFAKVELKATKLSLICPAAHPNHPDFRGIGELSHEELIALFPSRIALEPTTLRFASRAWKAYCSGAAIIGNLLEEDFGQLHLLKPALLAHLDRLPDETGISKFEQRLIDIVSSGLSDRKAIYAAFWKDASIYGMGDAQLDLYLDNLAKQKRIPFIEPI